MLSKGPLANGPRGCGSMKFIGVGYLFTRRLRGAATDPVPDGTGQGCTGPTGPDQPVTSRLFAMAENTLHVKHCFNSERLR